MTLSSLIVERGLASSREVEEALARQILYGGDLVTNLFEVTSLEEEALSSLLAESSGLAPAPPGELPKVPEAAARLVTAEVVSEWSLAPIDVGDALVVAVAEPLAPEVEQELAFALALPIEQRVAPLFRIRQALSRDYGVPLDTRTARLLTRLGQRGRKGGATSPPPPAHRPPPRPPSVVPAPVEPLEASPPERPPEGTLVRDAKAPSSHPARRRRGPLTADLASHELESAAERDEIFDILFEFARQFFDYTALFTVHGELAQGRDAFGEGAARDKVARIGVPLDLGNVLAKARAERRLVRAVPSGEGVDAVLLSDLERPRGSECVVVPVVVRGRVVALLFGDGGASGIDEAGVHEVERLVGGASSAFERMIVRRKLERAQLAADPVPRATRPPRAPQRRTESEPVDRPSAEELATPIHDLSIGAVSSRRSPAEVAGVAPNAGTSSRPPPPGLLESRRPSGPPIPREEPDSGTVRVAEEQGALQNGEGGAEAVVAMALNPTPAPSVRPSVASVSIEPSAAVGSMTPGSPARRKSIAVRRAQAPVLEFGRPSIPSVTTETTLERIPGPPPSPSIGDEPSTPDDPEATPLAPPIAYFEANDADETPVAPPVEPVLELAQRKGAPPVLPLGIDVKRMPASEQQVSVPAHKPPSPRSDHSRVLPSVIVDVTGEYGALVERVLAGPDDDAEASLLRAGAYAMPAIMAKFPGPTTLDPARLETNQLPRVAECGPILRLVASQRRTALPSVLARVDAEDREVRFWATYLLTELVYPDAIEPAIERAFDDDERVRRVARAALRALAEADPASVIERLAALTAADSSRRHEAIEALAETREALAVPALLPLLGDPSSDIVRAARAALVTLARQDFGADGKKWQAWWVSHRGNHRVEWLIDALMHEERELRAAASEELKTVSKEYFGYYDDLPKRERQRAQARYRKWWEEVGRVRFSRASTRRT